MRRLLAAVLGVLFVLVVVGGVILFLQSRDDAEVASPPDQAGPGEVVPGRCPASPALVRRDQRFLRGPQLLHAMALGNVVLFYRTERPPGALRELQRELTGRYDAELGAAGQAVILARRPGTKGILAAAWRRRLTVASASDPRLRAFAEAWLGEGAPHPCRETA